MRPGDKARLFHDLGQLLRSGITLPKALSTLAQRSRGAAAGVLRGTAAAVQEGEPLAAALATQRPAIGEMEIAVLQASERSGKIDTGLAHLAEFFRAIAEARSRFWAKSAYPLFIFHFGAVALSFPALIGEQGSLSAFLSSALGMLAALYLGLIGAALLVRFLGAAAIRSATLDRVLNMVPLLGPARRAFALTRFCGAYQMQLDAGINVPTALESAARASQSGLLAKGVAIALPAIRAGGSMAENLAATRTLPHDISDSLLVGEESGRLDEELTRLTAELRTLAFRRLDIVAEWLPKLLYLGILIFMAWRILAFYNGYLQEIRDVQGL